MRARNRAGSMRKGVSNLESINDVERNARQDGTFQGAWPIGYCVCPNCGIQMEYQRGTPCFYMKCPKCGAGMQRM